MSDLIQAHLTFLRVGGFSRHTIEDRARVLHRLAEELPHGIDEANQDELTTWLAQAEWHANTRACYHSHVAAFYRWAVGGSVHHLSEDPTAFIPSPKRRKGLPDPATDDQLATALYRVDDRWRLAITLARWAGLRAGEIQRLSRRDITQKSLRINGKGDRIRYVPTHPRVWTEVADLPDGPMVTRCDGQPAPEEYLSKRSARTFRRIGLPGLHLHMFRHAYATALLSAGVDIRIIQKLMGHASLATTELYTFVFDQQLDDAMAALPYLPELEEHMEGRRSPEENAPPPTSTR